MEKVKKRNSLKWKILFYMPIPFFLAVIGAYAIGFGSNDLQTAYLNKYYVEQGQDVGEDSRPVIPKGELEELGYLVVSDAQIILIPLWIMLCIAIGGVTFYKREVEKGIDVLVHSSEKIAGNELDFEIPKVQNNEIGFVCDSFDKMRKSLLETSAQNIRMMEEARRVNAAFSHDIRTPITVMKGYVELLEKYIPEEKISKEKELEILEMMHNQVERLENYALSMSSIQKLEDLEPDYKNENVKQLLEEIQVSCRVLDSRIEVYTHNDGKEEILVDKELVFEAVENIVSNATRYAKDKIQINIVVDTEYLEVEVQDDGEGFSDKILKKAGNPFLREDKKEDKHHFGLGIYISKLLCEKCGGSLILRNKNGACVKILFKISKSR